MRIALSFAILTIMACSTRVQQESFSPLVIEQFISFKIGVNTAEEIQDSIKYKPIRDDKKDYYTLNFYHPQSGNQRLSLNFNKSNNLLVSGLWIPTESEQESTLSGALSKFSPNSFSISDDQDLNPHSISTSKNYQDLKNGTTIRYNPYNRSVEAIARYSPQERKPTVAKDKKTTVFSFGLNETKDN